jgi:hypothetical protein
MSSSFCRFLRSEQATREESGSLLFFKGLDVDSHEEDLLGQELAKKQPCWFGRLNFASCGLEDLRYATLYDTIVYLYSTDMSSMV